MQVNTDVKNITFAAWFAQMPYDTPTQGSIDLPPQIEHHYHSLDQFVSHIFPPNQLQNNLGSLDFFAKWAILTTHNVITAEINNKLLNEMFKSAITFHTTHVTESEKNCYNHCIPDEILQHVEVSELPPATLTFKKDCSIILICNINVTDKLCNDTHLKITHLH